MQIVNNHNKRLWKVFQLIWEMVGILFVLLRALKNFFKKKKKAAVIISKEAVSPGAKNSPPTEFSGRKELQ